MRVFDCDAHIMEGADVFADKYWGPSYKDRQPSTVAIKGRPFWLIDGQIAPRWNGRGTYILGTPVRHGDIRVPGPTVTDESLDSLEISSAAARLADMDREDIELQVIYTSLFLAPLTQDPGYAAALYGSYNRYLADRIGRHDRLKWVACVSLLDPALAVKEVREAKRNGAIGISIFGTAGDRLIDEPDLLPFWEACEAEQLPVSVHVGWCVPALANMMDNVYYAGSIGFSLPILLGFMAVVGGGVLDRCPSLKVGFFEAGVEWVHFCVDRMEMRYPRAKRLAAAVDAKPPVAKHSPLEYLRTGRVFFNFETEDSLLPQVIDLVGADQLLFASDMPHASREHFAAREFMERPDLSDEIKRKLLWDNGFRYYGVPVPAESLMGAGAG